MAKSKPVVFLDIDGVLNSTSSSLALSGRQRSRELQALAEEAIRQCTHFAALRHSFDILDPCAVGLINRLTSETHAEIVLSSSHRTYFTQDTEYGSTSHRARVSFYLQALGLTAPLHGVTPCLNTDRGFEVETYIEENFDDGFENYIIIDNGSDFFPYQPMILVNPEIGFKAAEYFSASKQLGGSRKRLL